MRTNWKGKYEDMELRARALDQQLRVNMNALNKSEAEVKRLRDVIHDRRQPELLGQIGRMMQANAELAVAAARIAAPQTH